MLLARVSAPVKNRLRVAFRSSRQASAMKWEALTSESLPPALCGGALGGQLAL
jgi:hypothetical protein